MYWHGVTLVHQMCTRCTWNTRWWFQISSIFTPNPGEMIQFDFRIFFKWVGSKPPTIGTIYTWNVVWLSPMIPRLPLRSFFQWKQFSTVNPPYPKPRWRTPISRCVSCVSSGRSSNPLPRGGNSGRFGSKAERYQVSIPPWKKTFKINFGWSTESKGQESKPPEQIQW